MCRRVCEEEEESGGGGGGKRPGWRVRRPPLRLSPSSSVPLPGRPSSPELVSVVFVEFHVAVDHVHGGMGGGRGAGCRGWGCWEGGQGHCRRSSVSDRENAITTSSAPWSMLCCGSWLI